MHQLVELGKILSEGETTQVPCPKCNGGSSKERNFYITRRDNLLLYVCHRASCGYKGAIPLFNTPSSKEPVVKPLRRFEGRLETLPRELYDKMYKKYEIPYEELIRQGFKYATDLNRIYIPHYDYQGNSLSGSIRAVSIETRPKNINFGQGLAPLFPLCRGGTKAERSLRGDAVLTEDILSSIKLSQRWFCGYLNGTNLSDEGVKHLLSIGVKEIKLMLDGDNAGRIATKKLHNKLTPFFTVKAIYIPMGKDPKDLSYSELEEYLG